MVLFLIQFEVDFMIEVGISFVLVNQHPRPVFFIILCKIHLTMTSNGMMLY